MADTSGLEAVMHRRDYYKDGYGKSLVLCLILALANIVTIGILSYYISHPEQPKYFATTADGRITKLYNLGMPLLTKDAIIDWAARSAVSVYSYDFKNFKAATVLGLIVTIVLQPRFFFCSTQ